MGQDHVSFIQAPTAFLVVAGRARSDYVRPYMFAAQMSRQNVVNGQVHRVSSAVLTGESIAAEYLAAGQFDPGACPVHHVFQADYRGEGEVLGDRVDVTTSV